MPFTKGHKSYLTEEAKEKISTALKGKRQYIITDEIKKKISKTLKGRKLTKEHCEGCHKLTDNYGERAKRKS